METMSKICWLQISDVHLGYRSYTSLAAKDQFYKYLQQVIANRRIKPTMLFLTGDYVYAPARENTWVKDAICHIQEILTVTGLTLNDTYLVPGNHDIFQRDNPARVDVLNGVYSDYDDRGLVESSRVQWLLESFNQYGEFIKQLYDNTDIKDSRTQWCSDTIHTIVETDLVNIVLINTAIFYGKTHDSGSMILGTYNLESTLNTIHNSKPTIAIGHHPIDAFREAKRIKDIFSNHEVSLYLCGHGHVINIEKHNDQATQIMQIMAPTSMSRDEGDKSPCQIGFLMGEFDTATSTGLIEAHFYDPFSDMWDKYRQIGGFKNPEVNRIHGEYHF